MSRKSDKTVCREQSHGGDNEQDDDESDDDDYVPSEHEVSEEENSGDDEDFNSSVGNKNLVSKAKGTKRKPPINTNPRLARGKQETDVQNEELKKRVEQERVLNKEEKEKARADALWDSFMSDVGPSPKPKQQSNANVTKTTPTPKASECNGKANKHTGTVKVTKVFDFAGETVRMEKQVSADSKEAKQGSSADTSTTSDTGTKRPGGLGAVLGFINKKQKISTLRDISCSRAKPSDKSKLDWEKYKSESGISDDLKNHTNSKASYLERKEFLERADQRQFERERDARLASASKR